MVDSAQAVCATTAARKTFEPLFFAVLLCSANSLSPELIKEKFSVEKDVLMQRFEKGVELALEKANFLTSRSLHVLQAFVLLLVRNL